MYSYINAVLPCVQQARSTVNIVVQFRLKSNEHSELSFSSPSTVPPSVDRYFKSLEQEHLLSDSSYDVAFEPVPDPVIDVTPRNETNAFIVEG